MKLNQQKAETMGCLKLLRSCASPRIFYICLNTLVEYFDI